jgi:hypothetical protein
MHKILSLLAALGVLASITPAQAEDHTEALDRFAQGWAEGTLWAAHPDYAQLYRTTSDRRLVLTEIRQLPDLAAAEFAAEVTLADGSIRRQEGGLVLHIAAGEVSRIEWALGRHRGAPVAELGQMADVATTAAGLASGLAQEANPLVAPFLAHPAGWVAFGAVKWYLPTAGKALADSYTECVANLRSLGGAGWALGAWNLAGLVHPVLGLAAGWAAWRAGAEASAEDAAYRCLPDAPVIAGPVAPDPDPVTLDPAGA